MHDEFQLDVVAIADVWALRDEILRAGLPPGDSMYAGDQSADTLHVGAFSHGHLVAVSSICRDVSGERNTQVWRLGGMAVKPECRNCGVGTTLARYCIAYAKRSGAESVWCAARISALTFYQNLGFSMIGEICSRADMGEERFVRMELAFSG
ncbi:GNAT family N-acetyltransferase [Paraburkholderia sp. J63]|uniref:GNAT family N-acetyltransferase n=1 Tax=Paraburkholderia sp. J63 TaxID=2805434 RepID=UPI002ABE2B9C|nr:GNAT family N-acetyltransferase [Paraburkholderia sp. J63]